MTRVATVLAAALLVAGCGEKRETTTGGAPSGGGPTTSSPAGGLTISETEFKLSPSSGQVDPGSSVSIEVKNDGSTAHALAVDGPNDEVRTSPIAPGKTSTLEVDLSKPGSYEMYCPIDGHKGKGMKGTIKVGA